MSNNGEDGMGDAVDDMDDLFMDQESTAPSKPAKIPKIVAERVADLQHRGCAQQIAWSKAGCIAYVTPDGRAVKVRAFMPRYKSSPTLLNVQLLHGGEQIVHLCWDHLGSNLAVVDAVGRISIFKTLISLNRMVMTGKYVPNLSDLFSVVVGIEWLYPTQRGDPKLEMPICSSAKRDGATWTYHSLLDATKGPVHPVQTHQAFLSVSRDGVLRLIFAHIIPERDNGYGEVSATLSRISSVKDMLTHASFVPDKGTVSSRQEKIQKVIDLFGLDETILLATYNQIGMIVVYRIGIEWDYPFEANQRPPLTYKLLPSLKITEVVAHPYSTSIGDAQDKGTVPEIMHLKVLPPIEDTKAKVSLKAEILVIYTDDGTSSRIEKLTFESSQFKLITAFQNLSTKKFSNASLGDITLLKNDKEINVTCLYSTVQTIHAGTIIVFTRMDGGVDFRDRTTLEIIGQGEDLDEIRSFTDTGFQFSSNDILLHTGLSPNICMMATKPSSSSSEKEMDLRYMERNQKEGTSPLPSFALSFASACSQSQTSDDLLSLIQEYYKKAQLDISDLINELYIAVDPSDFTAGADPREVFTNQKLQKCFSAQHFLGRIDESTKFASTVAWIWLNLRETLFSMYVGWETFRVPNQQQQEFPTSLFGLVQWWKDLNAYMVNELIELSTKASEPEDLSNYLQHNRFPVVTLILGSISRTFLRYSCQYLKNHEQGQQSQETYRQRWEGLANAISRNPISVADIYDMLTKVNQSIKAEYEKPELSGNERKAIERSLLVYGTVPKNFTPIIKDLVTTTLNGLLEKAKDPRKIFFADTAWISQPGVKRAGHYTDAIRKIPLTGLESLRRCCRCGSYMEDVVMRPNSPMPAWVIHLQRNCFCGGSWVVVDV